MGNGASVNLPFPPAEYMPYGLDPDNPAKQMAMTAPRTITVSDCFNMGGLTEVALSSIALMYKESVCYYGHQIIINTNTSEMYNFNFGLRASEVAAETLAGKPDSAELAGLCHAQKCRFVVVALVLWDGYGEDAHANIILYDRTTGVAERWDPNGEMLGHNTQKINMEIANNLRTLLKGFCDLKSVGLPPVVSCPKWGLQNIQSAEGFDESGYCLTWSILYVLFRIINPDVAVEVLIHSIRIYFREHEYPTMTEYVNEWNKYFSFLRKCLITNIIRAKQDPRASLITDVMKIESVPNIDDVTTLMACEYWKKLGASQRDAIIGLYAAGHVKMTPMVVRNIRIPEIPPPGWEETDMKLTW